MPSGGPLDPAGPFEAATADAARLAELTGADRHDVAVVLGSGWAAAAGELGDTAAEVQFEALAGFPPPTVGGHPGTVRSVALGARRVLVLAGRVHLYEDRSPAEVVHAVRTAVACGCETVVLTNAAGSLRPELAVGQPVLIADHLNLTGRSPLAGPPPPPPHFLRFVDLTNLYDADLRSRVRALDPSLPEGVYAALPGPHYETPAEIRMLRTLGADLVGMSTALEAIAVRHMGAKVVGLSLVTNVAAGLGGAALDHAEVLAAGAAASGDIARLLRAIVEL